MITSIDHLVILVEQLDAAVADYRRLGFNVVPGGEHSGGETHNALVPFADGTYLELLAFIHPEQQSQHRWWPQILVGEGLIDLALACSDCNNTVGLGRLRGRVDYSDLLTGGRLRPDGQQIEWRMAQPLAYGSGLPFIIEDVTPRELRVPIEQARHANGVLGIEEVVVAVRELDNGMQQYSALLGTPGTDPEYDPELDAVLSYFAVGAHRVTLAQPTTDKGPLRESLVSGRGEGIYATTLVSNVRSGIAMDPALLHGAKLRIAQP
jgi:catechol 2,3-dioxygenase-like lactoylglutathione lyase family enzyme